MAKTISQCVHDTSNFLVQIYTSYIRISSLKAHTHNQSTSPILLSRNFGGTILCPGFKTFGESGEEPPKESEGLRWTGFYPNIPAKTDGVSNSKLIWRPLIYMLTWFIRIDIIYSYLFATYWIRLWKRTYQHTIFWLVVWISWNDNLKFHPQGNLQVEMEDIVIHYVKIPLRDLQHAQLNWLSQVMFVKKLQGLNCPTLPSE